MTLSTSPGGSELMTNSQEWIALPNRVYQAQIARDGTEQPLQAVEFQDAYPGFAETFFVAPSGLLFCFDSEARPFIRWDSPTAEQELINQGFTQATGEGGTVPPDVWKLHSLPLSTAHHPEIAARFNAPFRKDLDEAQQK